MQSSLVVKIGFLSLIIGGILLSFSIVSFIFAKRTVKKADSTSTPLAIFQPPNKGVVNPSNSKTKIIPLDDSSHDLVLQFDISSLQQNINVSQVLLKIYENSSDEKASFDVYNNQKLVKTIKNVTPPLWNEIDITKQFEDYFKNSQKIISFQLEIKGNVNLDINSGQIPHLVVKYE